MEFENDIELTYEEQELINMHRNACEEWIHGEPVEIWYEEGCYFCMKYEDGTWFHYSKNGEWW